MKISDFTYDLPDSLIFDMPAEIRGSSRLLVLNRHSGNIEDKKYSDIVDYLESGDTLILNNTKVIKARLKAVKQNGVERELVLLEKHCFDDSWYRHRVLYRRKLSVGDILSVGPAKLIVEQIEGNGIAVISSNYDLLKLVI